MMVMSDANIYSAPYTKTAQRHSCFGYLRCSCCLSFGYVSRQKTARFSVDLHRAVTWRQPVDADTNAALGDPERVFDAVQIPDACCNGGVPSAE